MGIEWEIMELYMIILPKLVASNEDSKHVHHHVRFLSTLNNIIYFVCFTIKYVFAQCPPSSNSGIKGFTKWLCLKNLGKTKNFFP